LKVGNPFEVDFEADGGFPPYHWQLSGDYPSWLTISYDGDGKTAKLHNTALPFNEDIDKNGRPITITVFDESIPGTSNRADNKGVSVTETFKVTGCPGNDCADCKNISDQCQTYGLASCKDETISKCVYNDKSCLVLQDQTTSACNGHGDCTKATVAADGSVKCSCTVGWAGDNCDCEPNCTNKNCGDDGCGGSCPNLCTSPATCGGSGTCGYLSLVLVPDGTFNRDANYTSTISSAFHMSETEITRDQFNAVMGFDPSDTTVSTGGTDPVQSVNWYHALVFCNKLSKAENLTPVYTISGSTDPKDWGTVPTTVNDPNIPTWDKVTATWTANGYRLPTEMEWMWAAMGAISDRSNSYTGTGTDSTGYTKGYAGSTEVGTAQVNIDQYAWISDNAGGKTHPAGTTKYGNELGLYDMSGNVWEWCWDWYDTYPLASKTDYKGPDSAPASGPFRVLRGGSWNSYASLATVASRYYYYPFSRDISFGFRVGRP
jgi:sulfatase modifying factor 1